MTRVKSKTRTISHGSFGLIFYKIVRMGQNIAIKLAPRSKRLLESQGIKTNFPEFENIGNRSAHDVVKKTLEPFK